MRATRACDLVPDRIYLSPSGRLCKLLPTNHKNPGNLTFVYLSRRGDREIDDHFTLLASNAFAISRITDAQIVPVESA